MFEVIAERIENLDTVAVSENSFISTSCTSLDVEDQFEVTAERIESLDTVAVSENSFISTSCTSLDVEDTEAE